MSRIRIRGFQIFRDRHGRMRCYHRKTRTAINLDMAPLGSAAFFAECERITALHEAAAPKPGTWGLLVVEYRRSATSADLAPTTRRDYDRWLEYLDTLRDTPLSRFNAPLIVRIRDKAAERRGRRGGNYVRTVMSIVFNWGKERGYLKDNPAAGIKAIRRPRNAPSANRAWSDAERFAVLDAADWNLKVPIALMMYAGLRESDAIRLPRSAIADGFLDFRTAKTGSRIVRPLMVELVRILGAAPAHDSLTVAVNKRGRPWTASGLRASWRKLRLGLEARGLVRNGLTLHGLRHTHATIMREAGLDHRTIADALGHDTDAMARHYSKDADLRKKMSPVTRILDADEAKRRGILSNLPANLVKPEGRS